MCLFQLGACGAIVCGVQNSPSNSVQYPLYHNSTGHPMLSIVILSLMCILVSIVSSSSLSIKAFLRLLIYAQHFVKLMLYICYIQMERRLLPLMFFVFVSINYFGHFISIIDDDGIHIPSTINSYPTVSLVSIIFFKSISVAFIIFNQIVPNA